MRGSAVPRTASSGSSTHGVADERRELGVDRAPFDRCARGDLDGLGNRVDRGEDAAQLVEQEVVVEGGHQRHLTRKSPEESS